jgi:phosphoribulokinase
MALAMEIIFRPIVEKMMEERRRALGLGGPDGS